VLELAWASFCSGSPPIGAVVTDADGVVVSEARSRRRDEIAPPGELAGTRVAHAELNALARLPNDAHYADHALFASVEPCCLCMGAAVQTGVGLLSYAWADAYAGAAGMVVDNPQAALKRIEIAGPEGGRVEAVAGLLLVAQYVLDEPAKEHVVGPWREAQPELWALAGSDRVLRTLRDARAAAPPFAEVRPALDAVLARS
jgi:tRNA(Arg) A34 adenosine deaminase TadA